jgi:hypothetical protein
MHRVSTAMAAAAALALLAACGRSSEKAAATEQAVERLADEGGSLGALRTGFPDAYAAFKSKAKARRAASDDEIRALAFAFARDFGLDHLDALRAAPAPVLREYAASQSALVEALEAQDVERCAAYVMTGLPGKAGFPPETARLADDTARIQLKAIRQGAARPVAAAKFSDAAWRAWLEAMARRGVTWAELAALSSSAANRAPLAERCRVGVAVYAAIPELPPGLADEATRKVIAWSREGLGKAG